MKNEGVKATEKQWIESTVIEKLDKRKRILEIIQFSLA
jgi:hypothetical protein